VRTLTAILLSVCLFGCASEKDRAMRGLSHLRAAVRDVETRAAEIMDDVALLPSSDVTERINANAAAIHGTAVDAQARIGGVQENVGRLQDPVPAWMRLAQTLMYVSLIVAVVGAMAYLGIGALVRPFMYRLGMWIAPSVRTAAKLDAEAVVNRRATEEQHRVITARRTAEPDYNAAFERAQANAKAERTDHA
jgi:hypothetical protein